MKATVQRLDREKRLVIHFDSELPVFSTGQSFWRMRHTFPLSRASNLNDIAVDLASYNVGHFYCETLNTETMYRDFLCDLLLIEGLEQVDDAGRYHLEITVGQCFDILTVSCAVAGAVHRCFYSESKLTVEDAINLEPSGHVGR